MGTKIQAAIELADSIIRQLKPEMRWMWGEALLGYALSELGDYLKTDSYDVFLKTYCDHWVKKQPRVDQADTSAPALITYAMQKKTGDAEYRALTNRVLDYIRNEPRIMDDAVNHLGNSPEGRFYPKSIWVDSLMMFSVFTARYASENKDAELMDFAARQPGLYSTYMQNTTNSLWSHSYWVKAGRAYPKNIFWGRGNGWVICSLPMILNYLPAEHPEQENITGILKKTSEALVSHQRADGWFNTVLDERRTTYREASATALIAAGWYDGVRRGLLDRTYAQRADKAYMALSDNMVRENGEIYMPEISGPTIPMPLLPYAGYKYIPRAKNWPYGIAAFIFAGIAADKLEKELAG